MAPPIGLVVSLVGVTLAAGCAGGAPGPGQAGGTGGQVSGGSTTMPAAGTGGGAGGTSGSAGAAGTAGATNGGAAGGAAGGAIGGGAGGRAGTGGSQGGGGATPARDGGAVADAGALPSDAAISSTGCGKPADQMTARYVRHTIMAGGYNREYFVYLPRNYDPMRPYRTIFLWTGCGGTGTSALPMQNSSGDNAILVSGTPGPVRGDGCFDDQVPNSIDLPFFDEMLKAVGAAYCVDTARVFSVGFSSGSWMTNILGCARSGVLRGQGNVSGGFPRRVTACGGPVAGMLIHDPADPSNGIAGGRAARDRLLKVNGCGTTTQPYDPAPCVIYDGCKSGYPVIWCETPGKGHSPQNSLSVPGFWKLFSQL